jgi:hypothetical protein
MTEHDPFDLSGQERTAATSAPEERQLREKEQSDLRWVLSTKQGRRFMWRLLGSAGVFHSSFSTNNASMAFNEGKRNQGLELLNEIIEHCPDKYTTMLAEQKDTRDKDGNRDADRRNKHK